MKLFQVTKKLADGSSVQLTASENQLDALRKDPRFTIGSEVRGGAKEKEKRED